MSIILLVFINFHSLNYKDSNVKVIKILMFKLFTDYLLCAKT